VLLLLLVAVRLRAGTRREASGDVRVDALALRIEVDYLLSWLQAPVQ